MDDLVEGLEVTYKHPKNPKLNQYKYQLDKGFTHCKGTENVEEVVEETDISKKQFALDSTTGR